MVAIIVGTIIYIRSGSSTDNSNPHVFTSSPAPSLPATAAIPTFSSSSAAPAADPNTKVYSGSGFQVRYPKAWGLLTCSNSSNFELDPTSSADQLKVPCSRATKPITVIVGSKSACPGQVETLGSLRVTKSVDPSGGRTDYRWCTQTNPVLDITTRYSTSGGAATATTDYSAQVEQMISGITFATGS